MLSTKYLILLALLMSIKVFGQNKPIIYYNEKGEEITKKAFLQSKDYSKNLDLYYTNDSLQYGILVKRRKFGQLDQEIFSQLKTYLAELSQIQIDSTQNIVVNYLTGFPEKKKDSTLKSTWNILDQDYLKKLKRIGNLNQFWINSPRCVNLNYYNKNGTNWISDKDNLFKKLFFPLDVRYGNYVLIKPDGSYFYYLGEHSKNRVLNDARKFFR